MRSTAKRKSLYLKFLFAVVEGLLIESEKFRRYALLKAAESFTNACAPCSSAAGRFSNSGWLNQPREKMWIEKRVLSVNRAGWRTRDAPMRQPIAP